MSFKRPARRSEKSDASEPNTPDQPPLGARGSRARFYSKEKKMGGSPLRYYLILSASRKRALPR